MANLLLGLGRNLWRLGPGNPIVESVVVRAGRRTLQTWLRTGYVAALMLFALWSLSGATTAAGTSMSVLGQNGEKMFTNIAILQLALVCIVSPVFTAGAINAERNGRTLPVLLSTPMSGGQIVLGSLLSRVFLIWALLAAGVPILAVTRLFGRVSNAQIFLATGLAGATALVTGAVAVAWSALAVGGRRSLFAFYAAIFAYLLLLPAVQAAIPLFHFGHGYTGNVGWLTPLHPISLLTVLRGLPEGLGTPESWQPPSADDVRQAGYGYPWDWYLSKPAESYITIMSLLSFLLVAPSVLMLRSEAALGIGAGPGVLGKLAGRVRAWIALPFVHTARAVVGAVVPSAAAGLDKRVANLTAAAAGSEVRVPRRVWHNPIAWKEAVTAAGIGGRGAAKWLFVAAGLAAALLLAYKRLTIPANSVTAIDDTRALLQSVLAVEFLLVLSVVLNGASAAIARERESESLDLLLTTPMTPAYYCWGKLRGLVSFALPMIAVPGATALIALAADVIDEARTGLDRPTVLPEAVLVLPVLLTVYAAGVAVVGLRVSLASRRTAGAVAKSVGVLLGALIVLKGFGALLSRIEGPGAAVSALSPVDAVLSVSNPWDRFPRVMTDRGADDEDEDYSSRRYRRGMAPPPQVSQPNPAAGTGTPGTGTGTGTGAAAAPTATAKTVAVTPRQLAERRSLRFLLLVMTGIVTVLYGLAIYQGYRSIVSGFQAAIRRQQA
jgi:ABC-type transport system involved in multi-copper enzyme maturation permease subunit